MITKIKLKLIDAKAWVVTYFKTNPVEAATVFIGLATGVLKLATAYNKWSNSKTWQREVKRREKKDKAITNH